jgi:glycosyltransferase involved in cell wall biosynthesis
VKAAARPACSPIRITRIVARLNIGGPAVHIAGLMAGLDPGCFENHLIVGRPGRDEGDMGYLIEAQGLSLPVVIRELGRSVSPVRDLVTVAKLVSVLRRQRPHIVETHTAKAGFVGRVAARLARVPVVLHVFHGHVFYGYFGQAQTQLYIGLERLMARLSDRIVAISTSQRRDITSVYRIASPDKVVVVPLGFDLSAFCETKQRPRGPLCAALGLPPDVLLVGYVGRLTAVKNPALFVEAARYVLERIPEARFVMVGDGELRPELEQQIAALGLADRVQLAGWQRDMPAVYACLDALVLTSLNEGTPVTAIEALAAGVPVVATAVGGVPDVVRDGRTGLLVPPSDPAQLAASIADLLASPERGRVLAHAGRQDVLARFSRERLIEDMESLYRAVLSEKGVVV